MGDSMGSKRAEWEAANKNGSAYLDNATCKAMLLADLKTAAKDEKSPLFGLRVTLREQHHKSFNVTLADAPFAIFQTTKCERTDYTRRSDTHLVAQNEKGDGLLWLTEAAGKALAAAESIASEWNYDRSDIQTDYFDVGFYFNVGFNAEQAGAEKHAMLLAGGEKSARRHQVEQNMLSVVNDKLAEQGATLIESTWGRAFSNAVTKLFGQAAELKMRTEVDACVGSERFDTAAADAAGAAVVESRKAGQSFRNKAARVNERAAKDAKAKQAETAVAVTKAVTELTGAQKAWATRRARAAAKAVSP